MEGKAKRFVIGGSMARMEEHEAVGYCIVDYFCDIFA